MIVERLDRSTVAPVVWDHLLAHVRVDSEQGTEVNRHAHAAAQEAEDYGQLALLTQTIRVTFEAWPDLTVLPLPIIPVLTAGSVTLVADGLAFTGFTVTTGLRPALALTDVRPVGRVVVQYQAGFGASATDIPPALAHAILDQAAALFDDRGAGDGKTNGMSVHMARILARYRRVAL